MTPLPEDQILFDEAPCGLVVTSEEGKILRANVAFCRLLGVSEQELRSRRFQDLLTMGGKIFHQTHWAPLLRMQGSVAEVKLDLVHKDQHTVTMLLNAVRREHPSGAFNELALFGTTERDRYERELVKARTTAENLLHEKTVAETSLQGVQAELKKAYEKAQRRAVFAEQMVAIVSHDLKTPLTAIKMASDLLTRSERTDKEAKLLSHITQSASRAERMIADLLDLALARVGRGIAIAPSKVELHPFIRQSVDELRIAFPNVTLLHRSSGKGTALLDADRVHQIVGNLIANSAAYGDKNQPITVTSRLEKEEAVVSVHNFGPVIPDALMSRLFEPMTRGGMAENDGRSVGLGLFIVSEIAKAHGGKVLVTSDAASGTTFSVHFPLEVIN